MMGSWLKKHWVTLAAAAMAILLGAGVWLYMSMYDLPGIQALNRCQCEGFMLEHEIAHAPSIYRGHVTRISKSFSGNYTVTVQPEATLKGKPITESQLKINVSGNCPYPFQKHQSYVFLFANTDDSLGASQVITQCSVIISTADVETMNTIRQWLNVEDDNTRDDASTDVPQPNRSGEDDDGATRLFNAVSSYESSIRIEEEEFKTWLYDGEDQLFFYSPDVKISLFIPLDRPVSREEYSEFVQHITVESAVSGRRIAYVLGDVNIEVTELPIVLKLYNAPQEDLVIRFQSPVDGQSFTLPIQYTEPFTFTVTSQSDPQIEEYFAMLQEGVYATHYVDNGQTHEYAIVFNQPVNRSSVYEKLYESLRYSTISWSLRWINDYEVRLAFDFDDESTEAVTFSLHGVSNEYGYRLMSRELFTIQAAEQSVFAALDLDSDTKETYFTTITPYPVIDVSPDGLWVLTGTEANDGSSTLYRYDIRDRFGNVKKSYPLGSMVDPTWVGGEAPSLVYASDRQILRYDTGSGETSTLWQLPAELSGGKLVSLHYSPQAGKLAAGAVYTASNGQTSYDLYIFDGSQDIQDQTPLRIEQFGGASECLEGDCVAPSIQFTRSNSLLYTSWERASDDVEGYVPVLIHLDLETLDAKTVRPPRGEATVESVLYPLQDGRVLQVASLPSATQASEDEDAEIWSIYDPVGERSEQLFETSLGIFHQTWLQQAVPINSRQILLQIYDKGWYLLDLNRSRLSPFPDLHNEVYAIDVEMNRIWFMRSGVGR